MESWPQSSVQPTRRQRASELLLRPSTLQSNLLCRLPYPISDHRNILCLSPPPCIATSGEDPRISRVTTCRAVGGRIRGTTQSVRKRNHINQRFACRSTCRRPETLTACNSGRRRGGTSPDISSIRGRAASTAAGASKAAGPPNAVVVAAPEQRSLISAIDMTALTSGSEAWHGGMCNVRPLETTCGCPPCNSTPHRSCGASSRTARPSATCFRRPAAPQALRVSAAFFTIRAEELADAAEAQGRRAEDETA